MVPSYGAQLWRPAMVPSHEAQSVITAVKLLSQAKKSFNGILVFQLTELLISKLITIFKGAILIIHDDAKAAAASVE